MYLGMMKLTLFLLRWSLCLGFTCLDSSSNPVDWYLVYKSPKISASPNKNIQDGLGHFYLDANSPAWKLSNVPISDVKQAVGHTLDAAIYTNKDKKDYMYMLYNDDYRFDPLDDNSKTGHTKGVVAFDKTSGFWLIHSVPRFPPVQSKGNYSYPQSGTINGQTFLCVSFQYQKLGKIATQLWFNQPSIYEKNVPQSFLDDFKVLQKVIKGSDVPEPWYSVLTLTSLNGQEFTSFAKAKNFNKDLYADLVAPELKQSLLVQTWLSGTGGRLPSSRCYKTYKVLKVTNIQLPGNPGFSTTKDHSKWAISLENSGSTDLILKFQKLEPWTCVGDINRMKSQFERGGGTLCLLNSDVWDAFRNLISGYEKCHHSFNSLVSN